MNETTATPTHVRVPGFGTLRLRGSIWWVRYSYLGKRREESARTSHQKKAERLLKQRIQETGKGRRIDPTAEHRVRMGDLFDALVKDYENNGRKSADSLVCRLKPLREAFGQLRALDVTASRIAAYVNDRLATGKANAGVNRELAALKRAFHLAVEHERISSAPTIKMLKEADPRQGFVTPGDFAVVVGELPKHLQDFARFGYLTGTRKAEIGALTWSDVDREAGRITFRREHAKNRQPRVIPFVGELAAIIERRWAAREYEGPAGAGVSPYIFHRKGQRVQTFRKAWNRACRAAGRPGLLFHDLRRSAVRNLVSAGVDQTVAMKISGHRTANVFMRYRITTDDDIRAALERTEAATRLAAPSIVTPLRRAVAS